MKGKNGTTSFLPERQKRVEKLGLVRKSHTFPIKKEHA